MDPVDILADLGLVALGLETLSKADLVGPSYSGLDPATIPTAAGIHGTGNWAIDTAVLGIQSVLNGRTDNNPPPGRIAHRLPETRVYSDYAQLLQDLISADGVQVPKRWDPTVEWLQAAADSIHLLVTYRPPDPPVVAVDLNK